MTAQRQATMREFAALYGLIALVFIAIGPRVFASDWVSSSDVHACIEISSSFIALIAAMACLVHYFGQHSRFFLIVGLGFFVWGGGGAPVGAKARQPCRKDTVSRPVSGQAPLPEWSRTTTEGSGHVGGVMLVGGRRRGGPASTPHPCRHLPRVRVARARSTGWVRTGRAWQLPAAPGERPARTAPRCSLLGAWKPGSGPGPRGDPVACL